MILEGACAACGKFFIPNAGGQIYCKNSECVRIRNKKNSKHDAEKRRTETHVHRWKAVGPDHEAVCKICGDVREAVKETPCVSCGAMFLPHFGGHSKGGLTKYCNNSECVRLRRNKERREQRQRATK